MKQNMVANAAMQMYMRALQANNMELSQMTAQALAANPVLEELPPPASETEDGDAPEALNHEATARHDFMLDSLTTEGTLEESLSEQLRQSAFPPELEAAALKLISHLNAHGYFEEEPKLVAEQETISPALFHKALAAVQELEPAGVGARDLRESLILQLRRNGREDSLEMRLLQSQWEALLRHRYADAAKELGCEEAEVSQAARRIARLNPDPGSAFAAAERNVIEPDLLVRREGKGFLVLLSQANVPQLALSDSYHRMMSERAENKELHRYLSHCFREGRELIKAIEERQNTILSIGKAIVARQQGFFQHGPQALLPMKMEEIANDTGVHISTVSRAVNGKFLRCDYGVFELRSFFSAALESSEGEGISSKSVQARIRDLIAEENPRKPLSDAKIEASLAKEGINVARRTIAKYREQLKILPASLRKIK